MLLGQLVDLYSLIVFGSVIVSWIQLPPTHAVATFLRTMTEPLLAPIRRVLPPMGGLDFSPLVLLVALQLLGSMVR